MGNESTIAFASNRGPVSFVEKNGTFDKRRGAGGLAAALDAVARRIGEDAVWIAAATSDDDRKAIEAGAANDLISLLGYRVHLLDIDPETYARYYDEISNRLLWFANHGLWDEVGIQSLDTALESWEGAYEPVNERFAGAIADEVGTDPLVLVQDYHLSTTPAYLRKQRDDARVLHFTHSSFSPPERGFDRLPSQISERVLEGMLASDVVGLHISRWCRNFAASCERIGAKIDRTRGSISHNGADSWLRSYPIPIDATDLERRAGRKNPQKWAGEFRDWVGKGHLFARVDRSEPSKNIVRGFEAYGKLLDRRPDLKGRVRFVACVYPSRQSMPEYRTYSKRIAAAAAEVNDRHPDAVRVFTRESFDRSLGALLAYDTLVVNPIMDGMNLVSKEGPAINRHDGSLVLSAEAGSFEELGSAAIPVEDPLDVEATTDALEQAYELSGAERKERAAQLKEAATKRKPEDWIEAQLADLRSILQTGEPVSSPPKL